MAKNLLIVESPAKSKTLSRFLGKTFDIKATIGHIRDLPKSKLGVDPDNSFEPSYEVIKGKEKVIAELKKAAKKATTIYLAPDPDREGEAIAWHVETALKGSTKAKFVRVAFNEITKQAVLSAIENPGPINMNLVNAQQARRVLDRIVGYTVSPFLWKTIAFNLSAGRVQSVALRLICEREKEVKAFNVQEYWQISAKLATLNSEGFEARLFKIDGKTLVNPTEKGTRKTSITSEKEAKAHLAKIKKADFMVGLVKRSEKTRRAPAPFITSTIQQEAAKVYGFSPKKTMSIAQKLYEGIELGAEGPTGLITYMRTDSTRIASEAIGAVRDYIKEKFGDSFLPAKANVYSKKSSAQDAHEAIRPTSMELAPPVIRKRLTSDQYKLYSLIWYRFIASQMKPAVFNVLSVDVEAGKYLFRTTAQKVKFEGFLKVYHEEKEPEENGNGQADFSSIPDLEEKQELKLKKLDPTQSFTKPPPRYSEAMLVKRLEADGIGRPSTYASIIATLRDRKYVELESRKLTPTDLGMAVSDILVVNLPDLFNVKFTAEMEKELDLIEDGTDKWVDVLDNFYKPFMKTIKGLEGKHQEIKKSLMETTDIKCEKCGSAMVKKWGRNGRFLACSGYPECKSTRPLPEDEIKTKTDEVCEKCGMAMVIKTGRFGRFMACSGYPDCKNTKPITLGIGCPKKGCGGKITEKKTKTRRLFYGCSNYPKCDFASWDMPVDKPCPSCKHPFMVAKTSKVKGDFYQCPECKNKVVEEATKEASVA